MTEVNKDICTVSFSVPAGMSCNQCENIIRKSIGLLDGISNILVDPSAKRITVEYDASKVNINAIREILEDQGYDIDFYRN